MKFLLIAPRFHTNLYYRLMSLIQAGHQVKVLVLYKGKSEYYENIDLEILPLSFLSRLMLRLIGLFKRNYLKTNLELRLQWPGKNLNKQLFEYKPDVILLKSYQEMLAIKTLYLARKYKIKVVMLTQTPFTHIKGSEKLFRLNMKWFRKLKIHAYITPIESNYNAFKNFGIENVYYLPFVYPAIEVIDYKNNETIKILSVGKFVKRKNHLLLIKAIGQLRKDYKLKLTIVGEIADISNYQLMINYIKNHSLENEINVLENLNYHEINELYKKYHVFVLPAYNEPAAYSPVEAMGNGLPVIVSSSCGTKCYVKDGENGFVFESNNLEDLIDKIKQTISDKSRLVKLSEKSLLYATKFHSFTGFSKKLLKIIED